jgi:formylglycine-generating enzyme required for sulfatase activity
MDHSVFISYSSTDKPAADQICTALESAGHGCWMAPRDIEPGADYPTAILAAVGQARCVVVIVSAAAVESPHILTEIGHAFSEKKPIVPFRISNAALPPKFDYFLSLSQWLDAHEGCTPANLARLNEAVAAAISAAPEAAVAETAGPRRRILIAGVAVLLIALGAVAYWKWPTGRAASPIAPVADATINPAPAPVVEPKKNPAPESKPQPWVNPKDGLTYVWIPPGAFTMGCSQGDGQCDPDELPAHLVQIPAGFWLGQTEVTNAAYRRIVPSAHFAPNEADLPAVRISWIEAKSYCAAAGGRLPTEAEWEYAARGGTAVSFYGAPSSIAWFEPNSGGVRHPVATRQPNAYGVYDMLGNAAEWVLDRYYNKYDPDDAAIGDVQQPLASNATAVSRGGYWESEQKNIRVSRRAEMEKDDPAPMVGVRCIAVRK